MRETNGKSITTLCGELAQPLGLAVYPDHRSKCVPVAYLKGVNFFFFYSLNEESVASGFFSMLQQSRENIIIATGSTLRTENDLNRFLSSTLKRLGVNVLDIFFVEYVSPSDDIGKIIDRGGVLDVLCGWQRHGVIRYVGVTTHSRELALRLINDGRIDVLMHRFNMAHRRATETVFSVALEAGVPVVAFMATRWQTLLRGHPKWRGAVPTAPNCYQYCLRQPAVQIVLSAPTTLTQLRENLIVLMQGGIGSKSVMEWEAYGDLIYGDGKHSFETKWL